MEAKKLASFQSQDREVSIEAQGREEDHSCLVLGFMRPPTYVKKVDEFSKSRKNLRMCLASQLSIDQLYVM